MALLYAVIRTNDETGEVQQILHTASVLERLQEKLVSKRSWSKKITSVQITEAFREVEEEAQNFTTLL